MKHENYVGIGLLKIAAFLYAARYVAAALLMGPRNNGFDDATFAASYRYIGGGLTIFAAISAIIGILVLFGAARMSSRAGQHSDGRS